MIDLVGFTSWQEGKTAEVVQYVADGAAFNNLPKLTDPAHITDCINLAGGQHASAQIGRAHV